MPVELTKPTPSTVADKAAALTFLKSNYDWPKSIQFGSGEDASNYTLSFVTNQTNGTIAMNVIKTFKDMTSEHYGTAYLDAMIMANMNESERTELVSSAASLVVDDHIKSKKAFIESQMQAIKMGQGSRTAQGTAQVQQQAESKGKSAFAGLLGALGAIGSGMGGFAGLGLGKEAVEAVEAQKLIQDLQNAQLSMLKQNMTQPQINYKCKNCGKQSAEPSPTVCAYCNHKWGEVSSPILMCPGCAKTWTGPAPQKCPKCGHLVISSEAGEAKLAQEKQTQKLKMWPGKSFPVDVKAKLKPMQPLQVPDDGFTDTSNDEQKFIQRVGMMSNLNVSIQGKKKSIGITVYRLFCDKCKTPQDIEAGVITQCRIEDKVLVEFCNTHRHVSIVPQSEGERKFKDV